MENSLDCSVKNPMNPKILVGLVADLPRRAKRGSGAAGEKSRWKVSGTNWSRGRAARLSSAKAPTAVRIRSRPLINPLIEMIGGFFVCVVKP